jgi:hypothetical protein
MKDASKQSRRSALPLVIVSTVFIVMMSWTWFGWPDPVVDFGRELYVPWQITQGKILYRDIAYFNGPLSPYFNAFIFELIGVSLRSLVIVNLILLATLTWMIWRLWKFIADEFTATVACVVLLCVFSFLKLSGIGNYNFVTPYSHELTHGVILSFAALMCVMRYLHGPRKRHLAFAGGILGLIFLTKAEVFAAAAPAICVAAALAIASMKNMTRLKRAQTAVGFIVAFLLVMMLAILFLWMKLPFDQAVHGMLGSWNYAFDPRINSMRFYRFTRGTLDPQDSIRIMFAEFACYFAIVSMGVAIAFLLRTAKRQAVMGAFFISVAIMAAIFLFANIAWEQAFRGITLVAIVITITLFGRLIREQKLSSRRIIQLAIAIFATGLTTKIALNLRTQHYGFALAMPGVLLTVAALLTWIPNQIQRRAGNGNVFRAAALAMVGFFVFLHLYFYGRYFSQQSLAVASGGDQFFADARGAAVNEILKQIDHLPRDATLAVVPEGVMVNYLARRENPSGFINLMPPEITMFGETRIANSFDQNPPDYVLLVRSDPSDYGYRSFKDYGGEIDRWIQENYAPMQTATPEMLLMRRKLR